MRAVPRLPPLPPRHQRKLNSPSSLRAHAACSSISPPFFLRFRSLLLHSQHSPKLLSTRFAAYIKCRPRTPFHSPPPPCTANIILSHSLHTPSPFSSFLARAPPLTPTWGLRCRRMMPITAILTPTLTPPQTPPPAPITSPCTQCIIVDTPPTPTSPTRSD